MSTKRIEKIEEMLKKAERRAYGNYLYEYPLAAETLARGRADMSNDIGNTVKAQGSIDVEISAYAATMETLEITMGDLANELEPVMAPGAFGDPTPGNEPDKHPPPSRAPMAERIAVITNRMHDVILKINQIRNALEI